MEKAVPEQKVTEESTSEFFDLMHASTMPLMTKDESKAKKWVVTSSLNNGISTSTMNIVQNYF